MYAYTLALYLRQKLLSHNGSIFNVSEVKVAQLCLTLCAPIDYTVHGILQVEILEWIPPPGDLPNPGIEPRSLTLQADSLPATREAQEYRSG